MGVTVSLAYYKKEDWDRLIATAADRDALHETWEQWHEDFQRTRKNLEVLGLKVQKTTVDINDLNRYCVENGLLNNGPTRSAYVNQLAVNKAQKG